MNNITKIIWAIFVVMIILLGSLVYISIPEKNKTYEVDRGINPVRGNPDAKNIIIEFSDFQCPACKVAEPIIKDILADNDVAFYYRNFPLTMHENSFIASEAAQCANEQGKFWEYHDLLFENQNKLEKENLKNYAKDLGLNQEQFNSCLDSKKYKSAVEKDIQDALNAEVSATPTFFVNNQKVVGAYKQKLEEALLN